MLECLETSDVEIMIKIDLCVHKSSLDDCFYNVQQGLDSGHSNDFTYFNVLPYDWLPSRTIASRDKSSGKRHYRYPSLGLNEHSRYMRAFSNADNCENCPKPSRPPLLHLLD